MTDRITCRDIVKVWLEANGFDGLCGEECGCGIGEDFSPCGYSDFENCTPAYKISCPNCKEVLYVASKADGCECPECGERARKGGANEA